MKLKESFNELKTPKVWVHYGLGTLGIIYTFKLLMDKGIITGDSPIHIYLGAFFIVYVIVDRLSHAVLDLI
jgi:hypothetical protein